MPILDDITSLLKTIKVQVSASHVDAGQIVSATLAGLPVGNALQTIVPIEFSADDPLKLTTPLDLNVVLDRLLAKAVLFKESDTDGTSYQNATPQLPVVNLDAVPRVPSVPSGGADLLDLGTIPETAIEGVAGMKGQIEGKIKALNEEGLVTTITGTLNLLKSVPVTVTIRWRLKVGPDKEDADVLSADFSFVGDPTSPSVGVLLRPETFDWLGRLEDAPVRLVTRYLSCEVTVDAENVSKTEIVPPEPIPLTVAALGVPRIAVFFVEENFAGPHLIFVPDNSPISDISLVIKLLDPLQKQVAALSSFATFATLSNALTKLLAGFNATAIRKLRSAEGIPVLNHITLIQNDWYWNDLECEDEFSSCILIGNPGAKVACYARQHFHNENWAKWGQLDVSTTGLAVLVPTLHQVYPPHEGDGKADVILKPGWGLSNPRHFGDFIASIRWR